MITSTTNRIGELQQSIESVIRGKSEAVHLAIVTLLAGGHLLVEDVPGVGKTTLAQTIARSLDCSFQRIQFTSDLLPSDIVGVSVYNQHLGEFEFKPGPIFANIILADEINRTTPKTQSSLLEAMAEGRATIENRTYDLPRPFLVLATQNPIEHHGTYPLPESQLDRFLMRVRMGYPSAAEEKEILRQHAALAAHHPLERIRPVMSGEDVLDLQEEIKNVRVDEALLDYLMNIVAATRNSEMLELGVSPRGSLALHRAAQALAFTEDRAYCIADDIKRLVVPVFAHRVAVNMRYSNRQRGNDVAETALTEILKSVNVPL
ncbi:MAG: MoxR family ATPase [Acidobacteriota bacterium]|nr:MoxR family ATPase [Acidobacteriota bacterium]